MQEVSEDQSLSSDAHRSSEAQLNFTAVVPLDTIKNIYINDVASLPGFLSHLKAHDCGYAVCVAAPPSRQMGKYPR